MQSKRISLIVLYLPGVQFHNSENVCKLCLVLTLLLWQSNTFVPLLLFVAVCNAAHGTLQMYFSTLSRYISPQSMSDLYRSLLVDMQNTPLGTILMTIGCSWTQCYRRNFPSPFPAFRHTNKNPGCFYGLDNYGKFSMGNLDSFFYLFINTFHMFLA